MRPIRLPRFDPGTFDVWHAQIRRQWDALRQWPAQDLVPLIIFVVFALVPIFAGLGAEIYVLHLVARVMIFAIATLALDLIVGYGALVSFGHAAFVGLGAYAVGILAAHGINEVLLALPLAVATAALFALATGIVCLRTKGVYFIMITLAFGQMVFFTASSLAPYGGDDGMPIRMRDTLFGLPVLRNDRALYYVALACLVGAYLLCRGIVGSRFGRVLRGARENPTRMAAIGFEVMRYQLIAYVISGALAGVSGFLLANATEYVSPAYMSWQRSGELIIMVLLGGMGTLYGAIIGAAAFLLSEEWLSGVTEHWKVIFGPLLVLIVVFARGGLVGLSTQLAHAVGDDPAGRVSQIAVQLRADVARYVGAQSQALRNAAVAYAARAAPIVQDTVDRCLRLLHRLQQHVEQLAAQQAPRLRDLRSSVLRVAYRLRGEISGVTAHLRRRFRGG
jgi:branched-chain amino acid transport system permease protein